MRRTYFDAAATTPTDPVVVAAMLPYFGEVYGNPASAHGFGAAALAAVESARAAVAALLGAKAREIVFTSGGTESNNTALKGVAQALRARGDHVITTAIEHDSVLQPLCALAAADLRVTALPVDGHGQVDPAAVRRAITPRTVLVSVMHANNEVGTIQPIAAIGAITRAAGVLFHTDAVQTCGHVPIRVRDLAVDLLSLSAHKLHGPKGVGALYVRRDTPLAPLLHGGSHEAGRRASTLNVPGIVGLGRAAELAAARLHDETRHLAALQARLVEGLGRFPGARVNGHPTARLPGNVSVSLPDSNGDLLLKHLDAAGIACSTGASCHDPPTAPSHVLAALGLPDALRAGTLRFSMSHLTTAADVDYLLEVLPRVVRRVSALTELLE
ncbi:MAG TPA: cysteine desulfurase family protein [Polyangia bacterium]|jgi:cysteine desulfurase